MATLNLKQLQSESDTWKRLLAYIRDENTHLKTRLSEILKDDFDSSLLEEVDGFQTRLVRGDEIVRLLRNDVAELDKLMIREIFEDGRIAREVGEKLNSLRRNIYAAEKLFNKLKAEFNNYMLANL